MLRFTVIAENEVADDWQVAASAAGMLSGVVNVTVRIVDVNDNRPLIVAPAASNDSDVLGVCVGARTGDRVVRVVATDRDSGLNARLRYLSLIHI